jgi:hypothetical protein
MVATIATAVEKLEQIISEVLLNEWEAQGHSMGGKIVKDIEYKVKQETNKLILSGFMYPYGNIIAAGTPEHKIPYSGRTGRGGTSLYIQALQRYVKAKMNIDDEKKSLSIAFAIATSQKKYGMPTPRSYSFSSTGKRRDWIEEAFKKNQDRIGEAISEMAFDVITVQFDVILAKWQQEINKN